MPSRAGWTKQILVPLLALILLSTSGCWSSREIDDLAFIMAIGVDKAQDGEGLIVSFRVADPSVLAGDGSGGGSTQGGQLTFSVIFEANTLSEAMDRFRTQVPRRPFLSHVQGILIGESLARGGVAEILDFFEREPELRRTIKVVIIKGVSVAELFNLARPQLVESSGLAIGGLLRRAPDTGHAARVRLGDFMEKLGSSRKDAFAPTVALVPAVPIGDSQPTQLRLSGTALFKDDQLVGYLDAQETISFLLVRDEFQRATVALDGQGGIDADVRLLHRGTTVRVEDPNTLRFTVQANLQGIIKQAHTIGAIEGQRLFEITARQIEDLLEKRTTDMIRKIQMLGSDVFDFGEILYRTYPAVWRQVGENWHTVFPTVQVDVRVQATVTQTGNIIRALKLPDRGVGGDVPAMGEGANE